MKKLNALLVFLISSLTITGISFIDGKVWDIIFLVVGMIAYAIVGVLFSIGILNGKQAGKDAYALVFFLLILGGYAVYKVLEKLKLWIISWPLSLKIIISVIIFILIGLTILFIVLKKKNKELSIGLIMKNIIKKIKLKIEKIKKEKIYKANNFLYISLSLVFGIITTIIFIILIKHIECNHYVTICSALISICGGAFASIIVAWLIDIFQSQKKNKQIIKNYKKTNDYLHMWIDDFFQAIADCCHSENDISDEQSWEYWFEHFCKNYTQSQEVNDQLTATYVYLNMIISEVDYICNGEVKDYIDNSDSSLLMEYKILSNACTQMLDFIFNNKNINTSYVKFKIKDFLSTVLAFADLRDKKYKKDNLIK